MTELEYLETIFFKILADLEDYLDDLTLVGGWLPYVYSRFLWNNLSIKLITTTDVDFGIGSGKAKVYPRTIFELLSSLDYKERHPRMDRMYPVVLYKEGKIRIDFIAPPEVEQEIVEKLVGRQIEINKINKFDFLLKEKIIIEAKDRKKNQIYKINCPKPSAFLYQKGATFIDREDEQKQAKDLHYMYFILRYAPDIDTINMTKKKFNNVYQFKIMLNDTNPAICRWIKILDTFKFLGISHIL